MKKQLNRTAELPYAFVKQQMREKKHKTSYVSQAIGDVGLDPKMEHSMYHHQNSMRCLIPHS
jgi:hypothetical protein